MQRFVAFSGSPEPAPHSARLRRTIGAPCRRRRCPGEHSRSTSARAGPGSGGHMRRALTLNRKMPAANTKHSPATRSRWAAAKRWAAAVATATYAVGVLRLALGVYEAETALAVRWCVERPAVVWHGAAPRDPPAPPLPPRAPRAAAPVSPAPPLLAPRAFDHGARGVRASPSRHLGARLVFSAV